MNPLLALLAAKLFELLAPKLIELFKAQFDDWMPKLVKAVVVSMSEAAGQLVVDTTDRVTDVIPGQLDDRIVDDITGRIFDQLRRFGL